MSIFNDLSDFIKKYAPVVATALGSPASGMAVSILGDAFGINPNDPEAILDHIKNNPESVLKLREIELNYKEQLSQHALAAYQAQLGDIQNARASKIASEKFLGKDWLVVFLVIAAVSLFGFCLVAAYYSNGTANQMFLFLIGQQSGVYLSVYAFYFSGIDPKKMFEQAKREDKQNFS